MSNLFYKNPISPIQVPTSFTVSREKSFGTNFSVLSVGGYMEVYNLSDLVFTIPIGQIGNIELSTNIIPIHFKKSDGNVFSYDVLTLNSDNISSGRRRLGMLVYVYETKKIYQYTIDNYDTLWSAATGATGSGGKTVVISDFGTTVKNNTVEGQNFINSWTASTIEGVNGYTNLDATWRELKTGGGGGTTTGYYLPLSGGTVTGDTIFQSGLTANTISATTYFNLPDNVTGYYLPLSGGTVSGNTIFQSGVTGNAITSVLDGSFNGIKIGKGRNEISNLFNLGIGNQTFNTGTTGQQNTAVGYFSLRNLSGGSFNSAYGLYSMDNSISGSNNTAIGYETLRYNNGGNNAAIGFQSLQNAGQATGNTATYNAANGYRAGRYLSSGSFNTIFGATAMLNQTTGSGNTVGGYAALGGGVGSSSTDNVALGYAALRLNSSGSGNVAIGYGAGENETGSNKLYIHNNNSSTPLIGGDFSTGKVTINSGLTVNTISATTYQNLPIDPDTFVTGFTLSSNTITLSQNRSDGYSSFTISLSAYTGSSSTTGAYLPLSGGTVTGDTIFQSGLTANTISATTYFNLPKDIFVTGGTYSSGTTTFTNNSGGTFTVTGFYTGATDVFVTGGTYSDGTLTFTNNTGGTFTVSSLYTGATDVFVTGGTYSDGTATFTNNTGGTFNVSGFSTATQFTGGTVSGQTNFTNGLTANTISATTYFNLPTDLYTTGFTFNTTNYDLTIKRNGGLPDLTQSLSILASDLTITGGTYNSGTGVATFTNNTGGTFTVSGFLTGYTDTVITAFTYNNNTFTIKDSSGSTFNSNFNTVTGLTINGGLTVTGNTSLQGLTATTISATTYQNLPNNVTGFYLPLSGGTVTGETIFNSGLTANTISGGTIYGDGSNLTNVVNSITTSTGISGNSTTGAITLINTAPDQIVTISGGTGITTGGTYPNFSIVNTAPDQTVTITGGTNIEITGAYPDFGINFTGTTSGEYLPLSGGTITGGTIFQSGVTANTISQTQYIDFTTGSTNPSSVAGRVFFDTTQKALSYFDISNNQVPIAMGQQLYTRVWNASGVQIDKGKVIAITGTSNNLPSAILARNVHSAGSDRPIGLAAENIPNGFEGLVLNNGILSGITLNTFANGDTLYLSDVTPGGYVSSTAQLSFTARTNEIGYVIQTGNTTGKIYVTINNEDSNLSLTDIERNILEGNVISSGIYQYTGMTLGTGQTINIAPARGWIARNTYEYATLPDVTNINYTGNTNLPLTYLSSADATYILINSGSTVYQQTTFPTPQQRRENILLGKVVHPNRSTITSINNTVDFDVSPMAALRDLWTPLKLINQGVVVSYYSAGTMNIQTSAGSLWGNGIGWTTSQLNPDSVSISGTSPTTFQYRSRYGSITGSTGLPAAPTGNTTTIDAHHYDLNGGIVAVGGNNRATNQRIYLFPTGLIRIQYGQFSYSTMANAIAGIDTEVFVEFSNNRDNGILIGILTVREDAADLSLTTDAQFRFVSKFGELLGGAGGISTTTLQQAYDNSAAPEILTNSTLGALHIKNGTGNADNISTIFEALNAAGDSTAFMRADGLISGSSVSAPTISGTTFYGLPLSITSTTQSSNLLTLRNNTGGTTTYTPNAATGGTYSNGVITLSGSGTLSTITGLGGSGGGGQVYFLNLSVNQTPYKEFSPVATTAAQQSTGTSISSGVTSTLASFLSPVGYPNTNLLPAGVWSFYLHSYKTNIGDNFTVYSEVYKRTSGGSETLLFTTDPSTVDGVNPIPRMALSDVYYSGTSLNLTDRILVVVKGTNNGTSTSTLTLVTEGAQYYSYATTPFGAGTPNYTTGGTYSNSTGVLTFTRTDGNSYTAGTFSYLTAATLSAANVLSVASNGGSPTTTTINAVTGGTYSSGTITLAGSGTLGASITGFISTAVTAATLSSANVLSVALNGGSPTTTTINAVTGGTYSNGVITLSGTGNVNGTQITGLSTGSTGGAGITWNNSTTAQTASVSNGYVGTATTLTTITLPTGATFGSIIEVVGTGTGLWRISQNANQSIKFGVATTATGTGGYLSATSQYDCVKLLCTSADTTFVVTSAIGNIFFI